MREENVILTDSYAFSKRTVLLYKFLLKNKQPRSLADQLLRCGTSVGANVKEAMGGFSRRDFIAKCSIAYKEARESHYWLRLLQDTDCIEPKLAASLLHDAEELKRILAAILISSRRTQEQE